MKIYAILSVIALTIGLASGDKIDTAIPCEKTADCRNVSAVLSDAFCKDGFCMCPNVDNGVKTCSSINAIPTNQTSGPLVYRTCKHDQDCKMEGGFCNTTNRQCGCTKNYVPASDGRRCVKRATSIDAPCADSNQCLAFLANTTCESEKCVCASGYHYADNTCWKAAEHGQPCTENQECSHIEGVICTDNKTCGCAAETVLNEDGTRCLAAAKKIQDECEESAQCTATLEHSICLDKVCKCEQDYHYEHNMARCFPNKAIGDACANNYECYQAEDSKNNSSIESITCDANKCTCVENYVQQGDKCVVKKDANAVAGLSSSSLSLMVPVIALICGILFL